MSSLRPWRRWLLRALLGVQLHGVVEEAAVAAAPSRVSHLPEKPEPPAIGVEVRLGRSIAEPSLRCAHTMRMPFVYQAHVDAFVFRALVPACAGCQVAVLAKGPAFVWPKDEQEQEVRR